MSRKKKKFELYSFQSPRKATIKNNQVSSVRSPEFSPPPNARRSKTSFSSTEETQSSLESYDAQRKRQERTIESEQQRKERLASDRLRKSITRENETEEQHQTRLVWDRLCKHTARENETENQRKIRLAEERRRSAQQRILKNKQQALYDQYVWPTAIPTQLKEQCLQDFSNHMSMSVLRQSTCIICNIRASANTMKEWALQDIPNLDKLSCNKRNFEHYS